MGGTGGMGGAPPCSSPAECPGADSECKKRTCMNGVCGTMLVADGTALGMQTAGDCKKSVCDGAGSSKIIDDNTDAPDDMKQCTDDTCQGGMTTFTPKGEGVGCSQNGGKVCSMGDCVPCLVNGDCTAPNVCVNKACVAPACNDNMKDGAETDVDCGGPMCPKCPTGKACSMNGDCVGDLCTSMTCQPTCTDGLKNNNETAVDCGGSCSPCATGQACAMNSDCQSGKCAGNVCADVLLLSEIRTRGSAGGSDEIIEIYNPTSVAVTFDNTWEVWGRNAVTAPCNALAKRITGAGQVIPPHGHLLFVSSTYDDGVTSDGTYNTGLVDAAQVVLLKGGALQDSVCFYYNPTTQANLTCTTPPAMWFPCNGAGVDNLPHNNSTGNFDVGIERKPGGALGNGQDTDDDAADWVGNVPSTPQNLMSAPTP